MQHSSVGLRLGGRRLAAVVAAGAVAVTLFAGAWAQNHDFSGFAAGNGRKIGLVSGNNGRKLSVVPVPKGRKLSVLALRTGRKL